MSSYSSNKPPRIFISYSWDSPEYKEWVASFAARLIDDGINARLDAWHMDDRPIPNFMNSEVRNAEKVLMLCSPTYQQKVHAMEDGMVISGSGYESMLITTAWFSGKAKGKVIPVLTRGKWGNTIPDFAKGLVGYDLSEADFNEEEYSRLLRHLYNLRQEAPKLGSRPSGLSKPSARPLQGASDKSHSNDSDEKEENEMEVKFLPDEQIKIEIEEDESENVDWGNPSVALDVSRIVFAIKSRYPELSEKAAEKYAGFVLVEMAKRIGAGDQLIHSQKTGALLSEVIPYVIDGLQ